jgi:hypothetical protein
MVPSTKVDTDRYILIEAARWSQKCMAAEGKPVYDDKVALLCTNLLLLLKPSIRRAKTPRSMEFFDEIAARGLSGSIEAAIALMRLHAKMGDLLQILGGFVSVGQCLAAPRGTRAILAKWLNMLNKKDPFV